MKQKKSYPVQRGSPRVKRNIRDLPLTGQGKTPSGGSYSCYGYPNMDNVKRAVKEYCEFLERNGMLDDDGHFISKEKAPLADGTQK